MASHAHPPANPVRARRTRSPGMAGGLGVFGEALVEPRRPRVGAEMGPDTVYFDPPAAVAGERQPTSGRHRPEPAAPCREFQAAGTVAAHTACVMFLSWPVRGRATPCCRASAATSCRPSASSRTRRHRPPRRCSVEVETGGYGPYKLQLAGPGTAWQGNWSALYPKGPRNSSPCTPLVGSTLAVECPQVEEVLRQWSGRAVLEATVSRDLGARPRS